ncbi:MAG TPA: S8 family serine peptidase, partial [Ilumatobacteraceae bacterium]|nr:S8 family serine peptidase [Ilumatobacteraceae bacterium]
MSRRALGTALAVFIASLGAGHARTHAQPTHRDDNRDNTEQALRIAAAATLAHHVDGRRDDLVPVEVLTTDNAVIAHAVDGLGGTVTGSVDRQLVQALVPAGSVAALAAVDSATFVRRPLRINRLPQLESPGFGANVGDEVALTNAGAWHDVGITGNVRVGIIDFFDLNVWNTNEHGPVPDAAHQFCPDRVQNLCTPTGQINSAEGDRHGVAVAEIVKDMAPGAELFLATTGTTAETQSAIDWFVANGVSIITRSLGAPYDGAGDGTGPLDSVVDYAAARGITWFNSAGNDGFDGYGRYTNGVDAAGYVDFDNGPGVDTTLRIEPSQGMVSFDGIRWANDWYADPSTRTDYAVEVWQGTTESTMSKLDQRDDSQIGGAPPLEAVDFGTQVPLGQSLFLRIHANHNYRASEPDTVEVATFFGGIEAGRQSTSYSAAKSVVDSRNPALVAVGAIDPADGSRGIAFYSSQGPTNDNRVKPDASAPSCVRSTIYQPCFNGTSAASPAAAGMAALLLSRGLALPGMALASLTRHLVRDLGAPGQDNAFGSGEILLPAPPAPLSEGAAAASAFTALTTPLRLLDTRPQSLVGPAPAGPYPQFSIVDLPLAPSGAIPPTATAVAVNVTSTDSAGPYFVQALPTLAGAVGAFSTLNITAAAQTRPNFAIVPVGQGSISVFIPNGGNVIVDAMGYFTPSGATRAGRYVPVDPRRVLDTRPQFPGPVPSGWVVHKPRGGEAVRVDVPADVGIPTTGVAALVVNVTATETGAPGFLQALPTDTPAGQTSNVNYLTGETAATHAIVPLGAGGTISVFTSSPAHIIVDVMGYITDDTAPVGGAGRFVPVTPNRYYDSRIAPGVAHAAVSTTAVQLAGGSLLVP